MARAFHASTGIATLVLALGMPVLAHANHISSEFQVNVYTTQAQGNPAVAADADRDFVVVWDSFFQDGSNFGIFGRRYTSAGAAVGGEFQVNTQTVHGQETPAVAVDVDGDFVVVWASNVQDGYGFGVFGQRYSSAGLPQGGEFQINTYTTHDQEFPAVAADADGDFVVVWRSVNPSGPDQDGSSSGVFGQRYSSAGLAQGSEFQVNTYTTLDQTNAAVAADADGDFVVVWQSRGQDGGYDGIFGQRYSSAGLAQGGEFQVNTYTTSDQRLPALAADADGDFVVAWQSFLQDGNSDGVFAQRYSSAGTAIGGEFQVNADSTNTQGSPAIAADVDGDFVVVWQGSESASGVFGRRFTSAGTPLGGDFHVNAYTPHFQGKPTVAAGADGDFVVVWESYYQEGGGGESYGVFGRRYQPSALPLVPTTSPAGGTLLVVFIGLTLARAIRRGAVAP